MCDFCGKPRREWVREVERWIAQGIECKSAVFTACIELKLLISSFSQVLQALSKLLKLKLGFSGPGYESSKLAFASRHWALKNNIELFTINFRLYKKLESCFIRDFCGKSLGEWVRAVQRWIVQGVECKSAETPTTVMSLHWHSVYPRHTRENLGWG